jgi:hypothetical protein
MRVVTQNLWGWYYPLEGRGIGRGRPGGPRPAAWSARRSVLAEGLRALDPDLVAFQEVIRHEDYDQVTDLLGPGYEVVHQTRREADGSGVSIASRWPLGEVHELDLQVTPGRPASWRWRWWPRSRPRRPSGRCCSSTTSPTSSWPSSTSAGSRP